MKKILLIAVLVMTVLMGACQEKKEGVVATVDGVDISQDLFNTYYKIQRKTFVQQQGEEALDKPFDELGRTAGEVIRTQILDNLITNQVLLNEADKLDLGDIETGVKEQIANEKKFFGEENFKKNLANIDLTEEDYSEILRNSGKVSKLHEIKLAEYEIPEDEIEKYYEENKDMFKQIEARHILVQTEEEAKNALQRLKDGEDFAELAKELSQDPGSASEGGNIGYFSKGQLVPEFEEFAFNAEIGQVSEPIKTDYGFHIIEVTGSKTTLDDFRDDITAVLKDQKFEEEMEKFEKKAKVKKYLDPSKEIESVAAEMKESEGEQTETPTNGQTTQSGETTEQKDKK